MLKKLAELKVNRSADYFNSIVKALEKDGFKIIIEVETTTEIFYIVAKEIKE